MFSPDNSTIDIIHNTYKVTFVINFILSVTTTYVVLFHSPNHLATYKWLQANITVSSLVFDILGSSLSPILIPRYIGYYSLSTIGFIVRHETLRNAVFCTYYSCFGLQGYAIMLAFFYRLTKICPVRFVKPLTKGGQAVFFFLYVTIPIFPICLWMAYVDNKVDSTIDIILRDPYLSPLLRERSALILPFDSFWTRAYLSVATLVMGLCGVMCFLMAMVTGFILRRHSGQLSAKTLEVQRLMFYALVATSTVFVICYLIPYGLYWETVYGMRFIPDWVAALAVVFGTSHTMLTCVVILLFTKPYRDFLRKVFSIDKSKLGNRQVSSNPILRNIAPRT